jgi:hypothetical protein
MKKFFLTILTATFLFPVIITLSAQLADSPWPMFHHDQQHTGRSPYRCDEKVLASWDGSGSGERTITWQV